MAGRGELLQIWSTLRDPDAASRSALSTQAPSTDASLAKGMNAGLPVRDSELAAEPVVLGAGAVVGRYQLEQRIGAGGVGQIWRARHSELGHTVAIKLLEPGGDGLQERQRFLQEARLSAQLGRVCRHIVRVEDHGVIETSGGSCPYLVMELLDGETLGSRLRREPRLTLNEIAVVVEQVARALTVTHAAGIIHRDLKPSNIFLTADHEAGLCTKLIDFGIARDTSSDGLTRTGSVIGTPGYMSPEQISGRDLDSRADLWSLCAVIFRMLTLKPPFGSGTFEELTARVLWQSAPAPSSLRPELPAALDRFMARGLARSAGQRFQSAEELSATFARVVEAAALGHEVDVPLPPPVSEAVTEIAPSQPQAAQGSFGVNLASRVSSEAQPSAGGRRRMILGFMSAGAIVASCVAAWTMLRQPAPGAPTQPASINAIDQSATPSLRLGVATPAAATASAPAGEPLPVASPVAPKLPPAARGPASKAGGRSALKRTSTAPALSAKRAWLDTGEM